MRKNKLTIFATYWNEIDWAKMSLKQIEKINPAEVIICDGCFDPGVEPIKSTDGTREIIFDFIKHNKNAKFIEPVRLNRRINSFIKLYEAHNKLPKSHYYYLSRFISSFRGSLKSQYRINQALTFNKMISASDHWKPGNWFMNYDADQFYSDELISVFKKLQHFDEEVALLTANEKTFFTDFRSFTSDYEKRNYNNMPHRIFKNTTIAPTRDIYLEYPLSRKSYGQKLQTKHVGEYFHYKLVKRKRFSEGYKLGDRKAPLVKHFDFKKIAITQHPKIIQNDLNSVLKFVSS